MYSTDSRADHAGCDGISDTVESVLCTVIVALSLATSDLIELVAAEVGSERSVGCLTTNLANPEDGDGLGSCPVIATLTAVEYGVVAAVSITDEEG